jgi:hypothetical protein
MAGTIASNRCWRANHMAQAKAPIRLRPAVSLTGPADDVQMMPTEAMVTAEQAVGSPRRPRGPLPAR